MHADRSAQNAVVLSMMACRMAGKFRTPRKRKGPHSRRRVTASGRTVFSIGRIGSGMSTIAVPLENVELVLVDGHPKLDMAAVREISLVMKEGVAWLRPREPLVIERPVPPIFVHFEQRLVDPLTQRAAIGDDNTVFLRREDWTNDP